MPTFHPIGPAGGLVNSWNGPHAIENAGQAASYSRDQLTGVIAEAARIKSRYLRFPIEFSYHFRAPDTIYTGNLLDWFCYTCFSYGVIPFPILHAHPNINTVAWNALIPSDGRYRHGNKPETETNTDVMERWQAALDILAYEAARAGCAQSIIPVQNGNELGKGGGGDWRPYAEQNPANPEEGSADGVVPASVVSFRGTLLSNVIRDYGFIAVSPSIEAETTTIMQAEIDSTGWKAVLNAHDKIAIHAYPELSGTTFNRGYAAYAQGVAYNARKTILTNNSITLPVWVTECGWDQTKMLPTGAYAGDAMATTCKRLGAEEAFGFVLVMNSNAYAAYLKTDFSVSAPTWPGTEGS